MSSEPIFRRYSHEEYQKHRSKHMIVWTKEETIASLDCVSQSNVDHKWHHEVWLYPRPPTHFLYEQLEFEEITEEGYKSMLQAVYAILKPSVEEQLKDASEERKLLVSTIVIMAHQILTLRREGGTDKDVERAVDALIDYIVREVAHG